MTYSVYQLVCSCLDCDIALPRYVGLTAGTLQARLRGHLTQAAGRCKGCKRLESNNTKCKKCNWIRKHGPENIRIEPIQEYGTLDEMKAGEVYWIAEYRRLGYDLLNLTDGGDGVFGYTAPPELRATWNANISAARSGVPFSDEHKKALKQAHADFSGENNPFYGKAHSAETKKRIAEKLTGTELSPEHRANISAGMLGREVSQETRDRIAAANRGNAAGGHTRWHLNRNVINPSCKYCAETD